MTAVAAVFFVPLLTASAMMWLFSALREKRIVFSDCKFIFIPFLLSTHDQKQHKRQGIYRNDDPDADYYSCLYVILVHDVLQVSPAFDHPDGKGCKTLLDNFTMR
jgi:hypothetical protein